MTRSRRSEAGIFSFASDLGAIPTMRFPRAVEGPQTPYRARGRK
jgi:hypothetical protein